MLPRRPLSGDRPSPATALFRRQTARWAPDFSAGSTGLEIELQLHSFLLQLRSAVTAAAALRLLARPERLGDRRRAWGVVALELGAVGTLWHRSRQWRTLREPGILTGDAALGLLSGVIGIPEGTASAHPQGDPWTQWFLQARLATVPLADRRGRDVAVQVAAQSLPHLVATLRARDTSVVRTVERIGRTATLGATVGRSMRRLAAENDRIAGEWADADLADAVTAERRRFAEVLAPTPAALRRIAAAAERDPARAASLAAAEEARLRRWLVEPPVLDGDGRRAERLAAAGDGTLLTARRFDAALRIMSGVRDLPLAGSGRTSAARAALRTALAAEIVMGAVMLADERTRRWSDRTVHRAGTVVDLATAIAGAWCQDGAGREERDRLQMMVEEMISARCGLSVIHGRDIAAATVAIAATSAVAEWRGRRRPLPAIAEIGSRSVFSLVMAGCIARTMRATIACLEDSTAEILDEVGDRPELQHERTRQRAFVHDGVVQVLGAVQAGDLVEPHDLRRWIHRELVRVEAETRDDSRDHEGDLAAALPDLAAEFARRGLDLMWETADLPSWLDAVGGTVVEVVREALNNAVKHGGCDAAWCGALQLGDGSVLVRVVDHATDGQEFRPGSGVGTATMLALAEMIGADIDWLRSPSGGTEVRLVVPPPDGAQPAVAWETGTPDEMSEHSLM